MSAEKQLALSGVPEAPTGMVAMMERLALNPDLPVEKLEKLLDMQLRVRSMEAQQAFAAALAQLQPELPILAERGEVAGRYKYALWEDIVGVITPILSKHGFSMYFRTTSTKDGVTVTGVLQHAAGHKEQTELTLPLDGSGNKPAIQALGSSTSYGKRYTASALLNLRTGEKDDDGKTFERITESQAADLDALIGEVGADKAKFLEYMKLAKLEDMPAAAYKTAVAALRQKAKKAK